MTDMMFGPTLKLASGQVVHTRLFALLDDCSRLIAHAQYYDSEKLCSFLDCLRQGLARRGFPEKLYSDQGKIFTSYHLQIVCANLKIRLCHAKPFAAWSKGKIERWFRTLQQDFEARLVIDPAHNLEELNQRLWRWVEGEYHQRPHSALNGQTPAERFAQRAVNLHRRPADRLARPVLVPRSRGEVRLDATVACRASYGKCPCICGPVIELRFNPFDWARVEVWREDKYVALAKRCDKQLNSTTYTDTDYDRPNKSS
jgi:hypothetical protein